MKKYVILIVVLTFCIFNVQAQSADVKQISAGIINDKATNLPAPVYPAAAQAVKAAGEVNVKVLVDEQGATLTAESISGHPLLRQAAEQAALQAKFPPTQLSGKPVKVSGVLVYNFVLPASNEEKLQIMGLATVLAITPFTGIDDDWSAMIKQMKAESPEITDEAAALLLTLGKESTPEQISAVIVRVAPLVRRQLTGDEAWQFDLGAAFGNLMAETNLSVEDIEQPLNMELIKKHLTEIKTLLANRPKDFPADVAEKFDEMLKFIETEDINALENRLGFGNIIMEILETISPN